MTFLAIIVDAVVGGGSSSGDSLSSVGYYEYCSVRLSVGQCDSADEIVVANCDDTELHTQRDTTDFGLLSTGYPTQWRDADQLLPPLSRREGRAPNHLASPRLDLVLFRLRIRILEDQGEEMTRHSTFAG